MNEESDNEINLSRINNAVVIPALNPMPNLIKLVYELVKLGVPQVIVVNDGSDSSFNDIFNELENIHNCTVLTHKNNRGKGRALKTAFAHVIKYYPNLDGVVTADADGQHLVEDIYRICEKITHKQGTIILGVRDFNKMPKRSYAGNIIASRIFQIVYNSKLEDTQTGLRGIPLSELKWMVETKGERYDYEINMLIKAKNRNLSFSTIPINTLYFDNNSGTHYSTLRDSILIFMRLISGLVWYSGLTIISGFIDVIGFFLLNSIILITLPPSIRIFISTVIARITSSICNYIMNRNIMFANTNKSENSVIRYYILFTCLIASSYVMVYTTSLFWKVNESIIKLIVDIVLGFFSYQVQLRWVFPKEENATISL